MWNDGYNNYRGRRPNNGRFNDRNFQRDNYRGDNYPNYDRQDMPHPFNIGDRVVHKATGTELTVISYGREQVECRKPDLGAEYFYLHELEPYDNNSSGYNQR